MPKPQRPRPKEFRDSAALLLKFAADAKRIADQMEAVGLEELTHGKVGSTAVDMTAKKLAGWLSAANSALLASTIEKVRKTPEKTVAIDAPAVIAARSITKK